MGQPRVMHLHPTLVFASALLCILFLFIMPAEGDKEKAKEKPFRLGLVTYTPKGLMYTPGTDSVMLVMQDVKAILESLANTRDRIDMLVLPESVTSWGYYYDSYEDLLGYTSTLPELGSYEAQYGDNNSTQLYVYSRLARQYNVYIVAEILEEVYIEGSESLIQSRVVVLDRNGSMIAAETADTELNIKNRANVHGQIMALKIKELDKPLTIVSGLDWVDLSRELVKGSGAIIIISQIGLTPHLSAYELYRTYEDNLGVPIMAASVMLKGGTRTEWDLYEQQLDTDLSIHYHVVEIEKSIGEGITDSTPYTLKTIAYRPLKSLEDRQLSLVDTQYSRGYGLVGYNKLISIMSRDWYSRNSMGLNLVDLVKNEESVNCSSFVNGDCRSFSLTKSAKIRSASGIIEVVNRAGIKLKVLTYNIKVSEFIFEAVIVIGDNEGVELKVADRVTEEVILAIPSRRKTPENTSGVGERVFECTGHADLCGVLIPRRIDTFN